MPPVLFIPPGQRGRHVHFFNYVTPANAGVVGAEGYFALLGRVWDDALLGASEIVIEKILEPHSRNEQEIPPVFAASLYIFNRAILGYLSIILAGRSKGLIKLLEEVRKLEIRWSFVWIVVSHQ